MMSENSRNCAEAAETTTSRTERGYGLASFASSVRPWDPGVIAVLLAAACEEAAMLEAAEAKARMVAEYADRVMAGLKSVSMPVPDTAWRFVFVSDVEAIVKATH